ncbi:MAG: polymerase, sigma-24 subunit, subfamily [Frankiales bacterium]|nr:polymerase, sigma-24 subunit, subfamily [Frankiales bacterium]
MDPGLPDLYAATSARLVGLLTAMGGSAEDAEEVCQEAWARLVVRWDKVQRYDDPEAWVRGVAVRLLISRARRRAVAARFLPLLADRSVVPSPSGDVVDLGTAMAALPLDQRAVLVLHHALDLPVEEVARLLDVPLGTVKSRLSRGRAALASLLSEEVAP